MGTDRRHDGRVAARRLSDVMVGSVGWVPRREPLADERDVHGFDVAGRAEAAGRSDPAGRADATGGVDVDGAGDVDGALDPSGGSGQSWRTARVALLLAVVVAVVLAGRAAVTWWSTAPVTSTVAAGGARHPTGSGAGPTAKAPVDSSPSGPNAGWERIPGGAGGVASPEAAPTVVVDVVGRVRRPGLVRLAEGARVADAVTAAGGASSGAALARVNLARRLTDGEQVVIPGPNDPLPGGGGGPGAGAGGAGVGGVGVAGPLDLNSATEQQLDGLPGVGPVTAGRIVAWRSQHSRFTRVDELGEVAGIGPKLLAQLRPLVRV